MFVLQNDEKLAVVTWNNPITISTTGNVMATVMITYTH